MKEDKRLHIRISEELHNDLKSKAEKENRTVSNYVKNLIKADIKKGDMKMKNKKWGQLTEIEKEEMLRGANAVDGRTANNMNEDGECIIDFENGLSASGKTVDGEIMIDDEAVIYDPAD